MLKKFITPMFILAALTMFSCEVDKTQQAEAPELDVDVEAEEGQMPEYDVDWANVEVKTRTKTITVPKVIIAQEEKEVEVPYVDVSYPDSDEELEEKTIIIEAEISNEMYEIDIQEAYVSGDELIVIANLTSTGTDLQEQTVRISDRLILKAPEDLDVKKYIIGDRPSGDFNTQDRYIKDKNEISDKISKGKQIYSNI